MSAVAKNRDGSGEKGYKGGGKPKGKVKGPAGYERAGKGGSAARVRKGKSGAKGVARAKDMRRRKKRMKRKRRAVMRGQGEAMQPLNRDFEEDLTPEGREELQRPSDEKK